MNSWLLTKRMHFKKLFYSFKSSEKINDMLDSKSIIVRKGIFFRKINISKKLTGRVCGEFVSSRKPYKRITKLKRR